jgi:dienelactone hydrolase
MPLYTKGGWFLKTPTQVHLAMKDDWTPAVYCFYLKNAAEIIKYPNATHAFDHDEGIGSADRNYLGHVMRYDKEAHQLSKIKVKEFFDKTLSD